MPNKVGKDIKVKAHRSLSLVAAFWLSGLALPLVSSPPPRTLPAHPGNVFVAGEEVVVPVPGDKPIAWQLFDYEDRLLTSVTPTNGNAELGHLGVGFYRLRPVNGPAQHWISLGVLSPLKRWSFKKSPLGVDVATAWFYKTNQMADVANLCRLAGMNWVRDRLTWAEMEPERGRFSGWNKYDASAEAQSEAGLRVLQVIHLSPKWANPDPERFPLDLRDIHRFFEEMARRWKGKVHAFEPWNEADIPMFGGHTGAEMAAVQKAAYLGLKAGNRSVIACQNVFALPNEAQLSDLNANEPGAYFDTFNLHHYQPFDAYPKLYKLYRDVSAGRPLWVTECAVPVPWTGDEKLKEPSEADLKIQAERVAKTFACSLHERSEATFYFLLPHYTEGKTQFGVIRPDLTPRPAYVALAAAGRFLSEAEPLGRWTCSNVAVRVYLFRAKPDSHARDVLVAWTTNASASVILPKAPLQVFDHLGRAGQAPARTATLTPAPIFAIFPKGAARHFEIAAPPVTPPETKEDPSAVVFQALWPKAKTDLSKSAYRLETNGVQELPVYAYNFGKRPVSGTLHTSAPADFKVLSCPEKLSLAPGDRQAIPLRIEYTGAPGAGPATLRINGDFGRAGRPVISLRLLAGAK